MENKLKNLYQPLLAAILGIALMFAFAPFEIFPLAVLAPAGLCALIYNASPRRSFWLGFAFGAGFFGSGVYWIFISISRYGDVPAFFTILITAVFIAILSLFPAITCSFTNRHFTANTHTKIVYAFPALWVLSEWIRSWFFTGFPWLILGYSQTHSPLKGFAPIFSVYGISLALMVTSSLLVCGIKALRRNAYSTVYLNIFIITVIWVTGGLLSYIPWTQAVDKPVSVSLVQGNIPQSLKWDADSVELSLNSYRELTAPLWGQSDIIIWPEMAIPLPLSVAKDFVGDLSELATTHHSALIFGIPVQTAQEDGYYNALMAVGKDKGTYIKRQLVPFGEFVPMENIFARAFDFLDVPMSSLKSGPHHQPPLQVGNLTILPFICYEIAYPELARSIDPNINLLLTVTNDAWFGESTAQAQHLQMAAMRSIEMARPGLFVSNDGITAIINTKGHIDKAAPTHTAFVLKGEVQAYKGLTPWMRNGIDPLLIIIAVMLFASYRHTHQAKRQQNKDKREHNGRDL